MKPRVYQRELMSGITDLWKTGLRRIAAVMATGGGKTVVFSHIAEMSLAAGHPVLVIAHRVELIDQAIDKLRQVAPGRRIGRMQGRVKQVNAEVVVGSVQTCSTDTSLALLTSRTWGLIIIDETHHATANTYVKILRALRAYDADGPLVLGVTATLDRADGAALGDIFEGVVEPRIGLIDLIRHPEGPFLVPPRGIRVRIADLNLDKVRRVAGDFNSGALGKAMSDAMAPKKIVEAWLEHCPDCPTIAFLPTVAISKEQAEAFNAAGVPAIHLDGTTPEGDRDNPAPGTRRWALNEYRAGRILILCNVGLFTEGTDLPLTRCVIMGRPTSSQTLYQQMVGRGLRLHPGKLFCWILDFAGVTTRHSLATMACLSGAERPEDIPDELLMYEGDEPQAEASEDHSQAGEGEQESPTYVDGDLAHEFVDLFGASHTAWLRTRGGTWFTTAGHAGYLFLRAVRDGSYDLVGITPMGERHVLRESMEIGYAMAAGDELVAANPIWQADRDAPWRRERTRSGRTRGEVWDDKAIAQASSLLDRGYA